jgi:peptidoglycan/LPS O-acetylase OafA/YrhL
MVCFFILGLVLPFLYPWGNEVAETVGLLLLYICFGAVVIIAAVNPEAGLSSRFAYVVKPLAVVGVYSYTIYLAQYGALLFAHKRPSGSGTAQSVKFIAGSFIGGFILSHVIERPFLSLREKWFPKRRISTSDFHSIQRLENAL